MVEEALTAQLLATAALTVLVGERITWGQRNQGDPLPALVLTSVSSVNEYADEGFVGLRMSRIQIDCWGAGASDPILVARAVRAALASPEMTIAGVTFQGVFPAEDGVDSVEQGLAGVVEFRRRLEFELWNVETLGG